MQADGGMDQKLEDRVALGALGCHVGGYASSLCRHKIIMTVRGRR